METKWKDTYKIVDKHDNGRMTTYRVIGFQTLDEAKEYAEWLENYIGWGYSPIVTALENNTEIYVKCHHWNSCD